MFPCRKNCYAKHFFPKCLRVLLLNKQFTLTRFISSNCRIFSLSNICRDDISKETEGSCLTTAIQRRNDLNACEEDLPYYIENGLRKVYPYNYEYSVFCKGRWINRKLIDVYRNEFPLYPSEEYETRILKGALKVNGANVNLDYALKNADLITSNAHRHELAVLASPIDVLYEDNELLVINKPPSIPVHPCGLYRYNSIIFILSLEYSYKDLYVIHRLDRLTSGVLIFAKTIEKSQDLHKQMDLRNIRKEYICRVYGNFPEGTTVCNKPLKIFYNKIGASLVCPQGKISVTEFQKLSYNGKSSIVLCRPLTGRTHQIRVHLQYLGYPIVNDPLYTSLAFGSNMCKNGILHKSVDQLLADLNEEHTNQWSLRDGGSYKLNELDDQIISMVNSRLDCNLRNRYEKDHTKVTYDEDCFFCKKTERDPFQIHFYMCLHAYKYESDCWEFKADIPFWASEDWNIY